MKNIIEVSGVSKRYKYSDGKPYFTLRDNLTSLLHDPLQLFKNKDEFFWALKDINFSVGEGQVLGVLGQNGAGKSTLLKLLSRITPPTEGEIKLGGRLGSLLEVGTGFHPELSGRENIYLNGAILGMKRSEVNKQFNPIVEFSGVGKFLDTPMKHYSSGMYMRLAFSVAAHLQSEILLIDEVLAVGDAEFQKKCLGKMDDIAKQGRTILFVSHNMGAVSQLCTNCIILDKGKLAFSGKTQPAIEKYLERSSLSSLEGKIGDRERPRGKNVTLTAKLEKIALFSSSDRQESVIASDKPFRVELTIRVLQETRTGLYLCIKDDNRRPVLLLSSGHLRGKDFLLSKGKHVFVCEVNATNLTSGRYSIDSGLLFPNRETVDMVEDALSFTVINSDPYQKGFDYTQQWGAYHVNHEWHSKNT